MHFTLNGQALDAVAIITYVCNVAQETKAAMGFLWRIICHNAHDDQVYQFRRYFQEWHIDELLIASKQL